MDRLSRVNGFGGGSEGSEDIRPAMAISIRNLSFTYGPSSSIKPPDMIRILETMV
jgi:hypothetical protein